MCLLRRPDLCLSASDGSRHVCLHNKPGLCLSSSSDGYHVCPLTASGLCWTASSVISLVRQTCACLPSSGSHHVYPPGASYLWLSCSGTGHHVCLLRKCLSSSSDSHHLCLLSNSDLCLTADSVSVYCVSPVLVFLAVAAMLMCGCLIHQTHACHLAVSSILCVCLVSQIGV